MLAIKIKRKPGIEPRKKSHLINQALAKLVKIPVNMPVSLEGWIFYSFMEKVVRSPDGFTGKNEEVKNDEVKKEIGEANSQIFDEKNEDFISGYAPAGFS